MLSVITLALLSACAPNPDDASGYEDVPAAGWCYGDTLKFRPRMDDSIATGSLMVAVRHDSSYPYSDLYLEVSYPVNPSDSADNRLRRDTVRMAVADPYGRDSVHRIRIPPLFPIVSRCVTAARCFYGRSCGRTHSTA